MKYKVGVPRGLLFYEYYPLWKEFLNELGAEVVLSPKTNKNILDIGVSLSVDDACLPVKVFHGHVNDLNNKVDFIFIPKIISVHKREYGCPKILGLPDMVKNTLRNMPPIIDTEINLRKSKFAYFDSILEIGRYFTPNIFKIRSAYNKAIDKYERYNNLIRTGYIPFNDISVDGNKLKSLNIKHKNRLTIMVLGHPYNIYDDYLSMNLIKKLRKQDIRIITTEMIDINKINFHSSRLPKRMFWSVGRKIVGSAFSIISESKADGIIYVSSFGCGLDSILVDLIQRESNAKGVPFTLLTLDEHTGEAGVNTRIEAFIDMIKWRYRNEDNISTHG